MTAYEDSETRRANIAFIKRSMETPLLTREHEYALARAWRDESNDAALHELINAYNRLVVSTAGRFKNYGLPVGDLIQEGVVGLLHAANRFEPDRDALLHLRVVVDPLGHAGLHPAQLVDRPHRDYGLAEVAVLQPAPPALENRRVHGRAAEPRRPRGSPRPSGCRCATWKPWKGACPPPTAPSMP